ncbi:MAG: hypothetical protein H7A37_01970 [Chlamydiales bacterium]|nr:hypothetical protein [Chlamydiia bacterium]MCP5507057.1 hypothetical protein [Chlamydiales bacterium]
MYYKKSIIGLTLAISFLIAPFAFSSLSAAQVGHNGDKEQVAWRGQGRHWNGPNRYYYHRPYRNYYGPNRYYYGPYRDYYYYDPYYYHYRPRGGVYLRFRV